MTELKFEVKVTDAPFEDISCKEVEPKLNTTKPYSIRGYLNEDDEELTNWECIIAVDDENLSAFRGYVGYIEDYTEGE